MALVFVLTAVVGTFAAWHYAQAGLTLSHYDARGHLVVSRRIIDSLTPGWRQVGAVWLPLPHLVNALPAQFDWAYRTGGVAVAFSILTIAAGCAAWAGFARRHLHSTAAALAPPALMVLNPNVLYLTSTPMTEPLLFGVALLCTAAVASWIAEPQPVSVRRAGAALVALVLVRYEGWAIAGTLVALAALLKFVRRERGVFALVPYFVVPILAFLVLGYASTGAWFTASGFFVPDPRSLHQPWVVIDDVWRSTAELAGRPLVYAGVAGAIAAFAALGRAHTSGLPIALAAAAALPMAAFYEGHPHRVRYMVPLVVAAAALAGVGIAAFPRRIRAIAALAIVIIAVYVRPPFDARAPMVTEAQWEVPFRDARQAVTGALVQNYDGGLILASMGSLGHYMHEASTIGLGIADFVHEGNGDLWTEAVRSPHRHVGWILIEERAEGGDMLSTRTHEDGDFLAGFERVADGGGMALYRRRPVEPAQKQTSSTGNSELRTQN